MIKAYEGSDVRSFLDNEDDIKTNKRSKLFMILIAVIIGAISYLLIFKPSKKIIIEHIHQSTTDSHQSYDKEIVMDFWAKDNLAELYSKGRKLVLKKLIK